MSQRYRKYEIPPRALAMAPIRKGQDWRVYELARLLQGVSLRTVSEHINRYSGYYKETRAGQEALLLICYEIQGISQEITDSLDPEIISDLEAQPHGREQQKKNHPKIIPVESKEFLQQRDEQEFGKENIEWFILESASRNRPYRPRANHSKELTRILKPEELEPFLDGARRRHTMYQRSTLWRARPS